MVKAILAFLFLALFALSALSANAIEMDTAEHAVHRGPCGGEGRATRMCREKTDDPSGDYWECKVVGCKRGVRRGFSCRCRTV